MEEEFDGGVLVSAPIDDDTMLLSPNKRKADSQSPDNSHDEESGFCFEDSLRTTKKNCLSASCFELRSSGREPFNYFDFSDNVCLFGFGFFSVWWFCFSHLVSW
jgi:hypothetical protein